jgi:hypothetical protein
MTILVTTNIWLPGFYRQKGLPVELKKATSLITGRAMALTRPKRSDNENTHPISVSASGNKGKNCRSFAQGRLIRISSEAFVIN